MEKGPTSSKQANNLLNDFSTVPVYGLTPECVRSLMRYYGVTIRALARYMEISMKRVREVRNDGIRFDLRDPDRALYFAKDWIEGIEGCSLDSN